MLRSEPISKIVSLLKMVIFGCEPLIPPRSSLAAPEPALAKARVGLPACQQAGAVLAHLPASSQGKFLILFQSPIFEMGSS